MKCDPTTAGRIVFAPGAALRCEGADGPSTLRVTGVRPHKGRLLVRAEGIEDVDAAQNYVGAVLYAPRDSVDVAADEYLDADLVGCRVLGIDGTEYGSVDAVEHYPASDMLIVGKTMVPMVRAYVRDVDLAARRIVIDPPPGLF